MSTKWENLVPCLRGEALEFYRSLPKKIRKDYHRLQKALEEQFGRKNQRVTAKKEPQNCTKVQDNHPEQGHGDPVHPFLSRIFLTPINPGSKNWKGLSGHSSLPQHYRPPDKYYTKEIVRKEVKGTQHIARMVKVVGESILGSTAMKTPHMVNIVDSGPQDFRGTGPRSIRRTYSQVTSVIPRKEQLSDTDTKSLYVSIGVNNTLVEASVDLGTTVILRL